MKKIVSLNLLHIENCGWIVGIERGSRKNLIIKSKFGSTLDWFPIEGAN